jgi:membrane-associated protease RseP (regulator of RpoE activity)
MIILFLVSLLIAIFLHELFHLIAAKLCKCGVEIFSIGFGRPIFSFKYKETQYNFTPFLLGGYCKLKEEMKYSRSKYAFTNLSYTKKLIISLAGVAINIATGLLGMIIGKYIQNYNVFYFGYLSFWLGVTNLIPIPALDGSYPILVWLEKIYGKKRGYAKMERMCKVGFLILMILNILCIPLLIALMIGKR